MIYDNIKSLVEDNECPEFPVIIPTYNNPSYLKLMLNQLNKYNLNNVIIIDNFSLYPEMRELLKELSDKYTIVAKFTNEGPREFYTNPVLFNWLPEKFIVTDPDIGFNQNLPSNFIEILEKVSEDFNLFKVGLALDIEFEGNEAIKKIMPWGQSIYNWEATMYLNQIGETLSGDPIYKAPLDTTFCFVNKKYDNGDFLFTSTARVGGNFISQHYGWYENPPIPIKEKEYSIINVGRWSSTLNGGNSG
jgi:hypothetical protein